MERLREWLGILWTRVRRLPLRKTAKLAAIVAAVCVVTIWFAFPLDTLLENVRRRSGGEVEVSFREAGMGLGGPTIEGLRIERYTTYLQFDSFTVRPRLATLWFNPGLAFSATAGNGEISGDLGINDPYDIDVEVAELDLMHVGLGATLPLGIQLHGTLSGNADLDWSDDPDKVTGTVELSIDNATLIGQTLPLPSTSVTFSKIKLKLDAKAGRVAIEPFTVDGQEIWGNARGTLDLASTLPRSSADVRIRMHMSEAMENSIGPLLPMAGFNQQQDAYIKQFRGPIFRLAGG